MLKGVLIGGLMPLREVYYSAWDAGTYHTSSNCQAGKTIPAEYLRQTYFVPTYCKKCEICDKLEGSHQAVFVMPTTTSSNGAARRAEQRISIEEIEEEHLSVLVAD
jgi:hypothetical protein